jgi:hypothetical protein
VNESPGDRLRRLLSEFQAGSLEAESFCAQFEHTYNLELDKSTLSASEAAAFGQLFEQVIWYSPLPDERRNIPNYRSEEDIARAVAIAAGILGSELATRRS